MDVKTFLKKLHNPGVPLPTVRDPISGLPSVSLTLVFLSFNICFVGMIGKLSGILGGVDLSQALTLFGISCGLYFSRRITTDKGKIEVGDKAKDSGDQGK